MKVSLASLKLNHQVHVPMEKQIPCRHRGVFDLFLEVENSPPWCLSSEKNKDFVSQQKVYGGKNLQPHFSRAYDTSS